MARRDSLGRSPRYKSIRNWVTPLVIRDKELSNLAKLAESKNSPTILLEIANAAVGKLRQPLPGAVKDTEVNDTVGNLKAANVANAYYVEKVRKIRATQGEYKNCCPQSATTSRDGDTRGKMLTGRSQFFPSP
jgi:hypothetical protein